MTMTRRDETEGQERWASRRCRASAHAETVYVLARAAGRAALEALGR